MTVKQAEHRGTMDEFERQARQLALENRRNDQAIGKVFWFPDEREVRVVEVDETVPPSEDGHIHPYFFRPAPEDGLPSPSAMALIRPDEARRLQLPEGWGDWDTAVEI